MTTYDVGLDADFLRNRLSVSGDWYVRNTTDLYIAGTELPAVLGTGTPKGNYGALQTKGWEFTIGWKDQKSLAGKPFGYNIKASLWDSRTWVTKYENLNGNFYSYYEGKELGEIWGFRTDGYFLTNSEANNWAVDTFHKNGALFRAYAGDLKFVDLNGDGVEELVFRLRSHYSMADDPSMSWDEEFFPEVYTYSGGKAVKLLNGMFITNVLDDGRLMCLGMNYGALDLYELPAHGSALDHVGDYRKPVSFS